MHVVLARHRSHRVVGDYPHTESLCQHLDPLTNSPEADEAKCCPFEISQGVAGALMPALFPDQRSQFPEPFTKV